ncbi:MAG: hypothetical protein LBK73_07865 [Treponema sp.]|nr:hypothetical protein [Treponema sp.]
MPAYNGPTPMLPESVDFSTGRAFLYISGLPTKARLYNHTLGWKPTPVPVAGPANYTANFVKGEKLDFPENYYAEDIAIYKVMESVPYKIYLNGVDYLLPVHVLMRRIQIKAHLGYGPGYTPGEVTVWRNAFTEEAMGMPEGSLVARQWDGPNDFAYTNIIGFGLIYADGQPMEASEQASNNSYYPANYVDYMPDYIYPATMHERDVYAWHSMPSKATTPVIDGKVLGIVDSKIRNHMDRDDDTQIIRSRRVSIDTDNDGAEDECMTLSPLYITHREMFNQIRPGDDISFRIHQYAHKIGVSTTYDLGAGDILNGRVFPEDVESYGDYINDRDFIYKWATGNPAANGDNYQMIETIELVNPRLIDDNYADAVYPGGIYVGDPYTGKASSLKSAN